MTNTNLTVEEYMHALSKDNQIQIQCLSERFNYKIRMYWVVQIFPLDVHIHPSDRDGNYCLYETSDESLEKALKTAFEWLSANR